DELGSELHGAADRHGAECGPELRLRRATRKSVAQQERRGDPVVRRREAARYFKSGAGVVRARLRYAVEYPEAGADYDPLPERFPRQPNPGCEIVVVAFVDVTAEAARSGERHHA